MLYSPKVGSPSKKSRGFTLVELVLAMGVASFALISIVGLIPMGLTSMRTSIELNVQASIMQRISGLAAQSDFEQLDALTNEPLYFDDQGTLVSPNDNVIFEVRLDEPELINSLEGQETWPFFSQNLKRMKVHIHYADRDANVPAIRTLSLVLSNSGKSSASKTPN